MAIATIMLVGWGIYSPENKEESKIFQEGLKQQYGAELLEERIFSITDHQKGSLESFPQVFNGEYAALQLHHNTNHVENNLLSQFKCGDVPREQFHKAVNSFTRTDKLKHMGEIRKISRAAAEYLEAIDQKLLFRADAEFPKYGILTNMAETMNGVLASDKA